MKRTILMAAAIALVLAGAVWAQPYVGAKTGMMTIGVSGVDNIIPIGVLAGYEFQPRMAIEGEFNYRISGGDWDYGFGPASATTEFKLWTIAGYFAYRYPVGDNLFLKGKAGILYENVDAEVTLDYMGEHYSYDGGGTDTGLSIGAGVGMKLSEKLTGEVEFTVIESDVNYLSVGLNMAL